MTSIQSHLIQRLFAATIVLSILSGGALFLLLNHTMTQEFDRSLGVRTHSLQSLVTRDTKGKLDIDLFLQSLPEFTKSSPPEFFEVVDADRKLVVCSAKTSLSHKNSGPTEHWDATLPTGEPARAMQVTFTPSFEEDDEADEPKSTTLAATTPEFRLPLTLTVARDRRPLTILQWRVAAAIAVSTLLFSAFTVVAAVWIVRRGLSSLRIVAADAASIDFRNPDARFKSADIPAELDPIVQKLNDLLHRVADAFGRERQFTAAVSHELRTPIAELQLAAEIALRDRTNMELSYRAVTQSRDIAIQMQRIVSALLSIASSERADEPAPLEPVYLLDAVEQVIARHAERMEERHLNPVIHIDPMVEVRADAALLDGVLENLIGNATQYASVGTTLAISANVLGDVFRLTFDNATADLAATDVERMFNAFWRKDASRSGNEHVGLGLSLTRAYCVAMRLPINATLKPNNRLAITIDFLLVQTLPPSVREKHLTPAIGGLK